MKAIALANYGHALVSQEDYESLSQYVWRAWVAKPGYTYACRSDGGKRVLMHRQVCGADGLVVDHINGDTLDNRRENLRAVTQSENKRNITKPTRSASGHRNIYQHKYGFIVRYFVDGVRRYGGWHTSLELALAARDSMREQDYIAAIVRAAA